jgi:hypothetical protein
VRSVTELFWGVDGRTHRLGPDGLALCRTQIDNSRPPEQRVISGCSVCDIALRDRSLRQHRASTGQRPIIPIVLAVLVGLLLLWAVLR